MMFKFKVLFSSLIVCCYSHQVLAQVRLHDNPNNAKLIITDISNFWIAYDSAKNLPLDEQKQIYRSLYLNKASEGFQSWIDKREKKVGELVEGVNEMIPFYESIRDNTFKVESYKKDIRAAFYGIKYLYPEARFPDVYFFIWYFLNSGSTTSDAGLLIATEAQTVAEDTPLDQFPEIHHELVKTLNLDRLASVVAHESIHMQQADVENKNLLEHAVREGSADFIAELVTGKNPSQAVHDYADPREKVLWEEFQQKMYGEDKSGWVGIPADRPAGLAYWMGYKIVESYYNQQENKDQAVRELINTTDYESIYRKSRYSEKFED
ncbi:DUF2268 domain-containing putative Zn-dependent protease [Catalinimonas sp. 4WD22]|uniref:gliding motility protein GldB-related protein n=1 Tax=Catalinimonas locisalis TaxID=3133978 RepID=UPI00310193D7